MVEIILATYNGEKYLEDQIVSIINQTYSNWILRVIDDCSTDQTFEILNKYKDILGDKIYITSNEKNTGKAALNFFNMLMTCSCDYVMTCDQDDIWKENKIELMLLEMMRVEQRVSSRVPVLVHSDLVITNSKMEQISSSMFQYQKMNKKSKSLNQFLVQNTVTGCSMMINKALASYINKIPNHAIMHDWWCALIASAFGEISFIDESTLYYRQHGNNQVGAKKVQSIKYIIMKSMSLSCIKVGLQDTYKQAAEFLGFYEKSLTKPQIELIRIYCGLENENKFKKIMYTYRYKLWKYGIVRKIGQLIVL